MKIKFILLALFILFIAASCYLASNNDSANNSSLVFKINAPMRTHGAEAGDAGELRIKFFEASEMQEDKAYTIDNNYPFLYTSDFLYHYEDAISYLTKPTPITVNGKKTTISYFKEDPRNPSYIGPDNGIIEIDLIPAGVSLRAVVEYNYYYEPYCFSGDYHDYGDTSYISHAGVSKPFTIKKGSSTTIEIDLVKTAYGTVSFDFPNNGTDYSSLNPPYFVLASEEFDSNFIIFDGKNILGYPARQYGKNNSEPQHIDMLPGKKLRLLIYTEPSESRYSGYGDEPFHTSLGDIYGTKLTAGLSKTFELAPGETRKIDLDWSYAFFS